MHVRVVAYDVLLCVFGVREALLCGAALAAEAGSISGTSISSIIYNYQAIKVSA